MTTDTSTPGIGFLLRVIVKAVALFAVCNFATILLPDALLSTASVYNTLVPGRERFPFSNASQSDNNVTISNLDVLFGSHIIYSAARDDDEYRVFLLGDSAMWGFNLVAADQYATHINAQNPATPDEQPVRVYNLAYPGTSAAKDLLILEYAMRYSPDLVIWMVTPTGLTHEEQISHDITRSNPNFARTVFDNYRLDLEPDYITTTLWERTLYGQREQLFRLLRLQLYAGTWAGIGFDHRIPDTYPTPTNDFDDDLRWRDRDPGHNLLDQWDMDVVRAVMNRTSPDMILINEPVYRADGENSDLHYNSYLPRWVNDTYRETMAALATENDWTYYDWWDAVPPSEFIDPLHVKPDGAQQVSDMLLDVILENAED
ncbi:MAG: hypothetical protein AAF787_21010 [Chloroflexota bacterium]